MSRWATHLSRKTRVTEDTEHYLIQSERWSRGEEKNGEERRGEETRGEETRRVVKSE